MYAYPPVELKLKVKGHHMKYLGGHRVEVVVKQQPIRKLVARRGWMVSNKFQPLLPPGKTCYPL